MTARTPLALLATTAALAIAAPGAIARPLHALFPGDCVSDTSVATCGAGNVSHGLFPPNDVAVSPDGRNLYAAAPVDGAVTAFTRSPAGVLVPAQCLDAVGGPDPCPGPDVPGLTGASAVAVSPDGRSVYVAAQNADAVVRFDRAADGTLTPAGCVGDAGTTVCGASTAEGLDQAIDVAVSDDGASVYVAGFLDDAVVRLDRAASGGLTPQGCIDDAGGPNPCGAGNETAGLNGARAIAPSPDGGSLYVASSADNAVVRLDRAPAGAIAASGQCFDSTGPACTALTGLVNPGGVAVSPDGASVYATSSSSDAVFRFTRAAGGALTAAGCVDDVGGALACASEAEGLDLPVGVAVSPDGEQVLVAGNADSALLRLNRTPSGAIADGGCIATTGGGQCGAGNESSGLSAAGAVAVAPDGGAVFVTSAGSSLAIARVNREIPPACRATTSSGAFGAPQSVALNCADLNGDPLTLSVSDPPLGGTLGTIDQAAHTVEFAPAAGFFGSDAFTYRAVADGKASGDALARLAVGAPPAGGGTGGGAGGGTTVVTRPPKLLALLASAALRVRRGAAVRVALAASAPGTARLEVRQGRRLRATAAKRITRAGRTTITFTGRVRGAPRLAAGRYTVRLTITGTDQQIATDTARLTVAR